jgi:threonine/homoserine/homoserine lactone efflux protein
VPDAQLLWFVGAGLLLNLTPGPDVLYVVSHALRGGMRAGMLAAAGISAGVFVHILAAAVGLSALLVASGAAFALLKWAGAAYLVWMGFRMLRSGGADLALLQDAAAQDVPATNLRSVFLKGFWTNALNPKVALFFLAFLPQFIAPDASHKSLAFLVLGLVFNFNALWVNALWALSAAWLARNSKLLQRSMHWLDRIGGALFIAFGLRLALTDNVAR